MSPFFIVSLVILVILVVALIVLYFLGKRAQKKQQEQQEKIDAMAQTVSILVIDKGRMKLKEAGFPSIVLESTPKYLRRSKVYVVKAKVGPKIMTFMCDDKVFPLIPVKKEVKATVSGIYITAVRGVRGPLEAPKKKKGFLARAKESAKKAAMENASKSKRNKNRKESTKRMLIKNRQFRHMSVLAIFQFLYSLLPSIQKNRITPCLSSVSIRTDGTHISFVPFQQIGCCLNRLLQRFA